jgi:hypothetical protein
MPTSDPTNSGVTAGRSAGPAAHFHARVLAQIERVRTGREIAVPGHERVLPPWKEYLARSPVPRGADGQRLARDGEISNRVDLDALDRALETKGEPRATSRGCLCEGTACHEADREHRRRPPAEDPPVSHDATVLRRERHGHAA